MKNLQTIATIIFDLGGVLFDYDPYTIGQALTNPNIKQPFEPIEEGIQILQKLYKQCTTGSSPKYRLLICTNWTQSSLEVLKRNFKGTLSLFDDIITPIDSGYEKPDRHMFSYITNTYDLLPEKCLFIDDSPANVEGAKQAGMNAIVCTDWEKVKKELENFNIHV